MLEASAKDRGIDWSRLARGSCSLIDALGISRGPIPGQQVVEALGGMSGDTGQHIGEPGLRIDVVHLGRDDQAVHHRGTRPAAIRATEQP